MPIEATIKPNLYKDSVALMRVSQRLQDEAGVRRATLLMGTPANKAMLDEAGLMCAELAHAAPSDLMLVVEAESAAALDAARRTIDALLDAAPVHEGGGEAVAAPPRSIALAAAHGVHAALAQISVPGPYAGAEAMKALRQGMHAFVFSDNVSLAQERALKELAQRKGLLVMGPDCGTTVVRGVPLGFANVVRAGGIGLVGASGTGLQEVMCRIHAMGEGISHAIGTGSRDVHEAIGGTTMCQAIDLLAADAATKVIGIVSKPPAATVADRVIRHATRSGKPCVVLFLGADPKLRSFPPQLHPVATLYDVAATAVALAKRLPAARPASAEPERELVEREARALAPRQHALRGLYSGGTFCVEAQLLWSALGLAVQSNVPLDASAAGSEAAPRDGHRALDLGADEFTVGRPHPMIDMSTRIERIATEARDPSVALLVLDVVLGYGSHPDPAGALAPALADAKAAATRDGRHLVVATFVCGTEDDPQHLSGQQAALRGAGAIVASDSTAAARLAGAIAVAASRARERRDVAHTER